MQLNTSFFQTVGVGGKDSIPPPSAGRPPEETLTLKAVLKAELPHKTAAFVFYECQTLDNSLYGREVFPTITHTYRVGTDSELKRHNWLWCCKSGSLPFSIWMCVANGLKEPDARETL